MATILITGANRGVGLELARGYADRGDRVLACCRDPRSAQALNELADTRDSLSIHGVQLADAGSVKGLRDAIGDTAIDVLLNNAGTPGPAFETQTLMNMDYDGWAETFAVNTMAPLRMLQTFHDNLKRAGGKAITITSQFGALAFDVPIAYAYSSSKAAVNKVMRMGSQELAKEGIAVGLIHPGWVRTDMGGPKGELSPEESATGIIKVIDGITLENTGCFMKWNGETHDW